MFRSAANIALLAVLFYMAFYAYRKLGLNYHYKKHYPGDCRYISGYFFHVHLPPYLVVYYFQFCFFLLLHLRAIELYKFFFSKMFGLMKVNKYT